MSRLLMLMLMQVQMLMPRRLGRTESLARSPVPVANLLFVDLCNSAGIIMCGPFIMAVCCCVVCVVELTGYGVAACCGGGCDVAAATRDSLIHTRTAHTTSLRVAPLGSGLVRTRDIALVTNHTTLMLASLSY